jgi:hypothetical protein
MFNEMMSNVKDFKEHFTRILFLAKIGENLIYIIESVLKVTYTFDYLNLRKI